MIPPAKFSHHFQYKNSDCTIITDLEENIPLAIAQFQMDSHQLEDFVLQHPMWQKSYDPVNLVSPEQNKTVMFDMELEAKKCQVGPMAAVAGALADRMVNQMLQTPLTRIAVVENGGEIAIRAQEEILIGLIVLSSSLQSQIGFKYEGDNQNLGVATSSATFGHAESFGEADAVIIFAPNAALADAAATYVCNEVKGNNAQKAIDRGLRAFKNIPELQGVMIVKDQLIAQLGTIPPLIKIKDEEQVLMKKKLENREDYFP